MFHEDLKKKIDEYVHLIYKMTKNFPKDELYGVVSQIRRSSMSVILNYIEGYARRKNKVNINFLEIAYGSSQESKYLLEFSLKENYIDHSEYEKPAAIADEIGAMLWSTIELKSK